MRIKKAISSNEYLRAEGVWVRNFTKKGIAPIGLSHMYSKEDHKLLLHNEEKNRKRSRISDENLRFRNVVIVSDGYDFENRHLLCSKLPSDVCILSINGALKGWKLKEEKSINAHINTNPYREALMDLPERDSAYYPVCISSIRGNQEFCQRYLGDIYVYVPTPERIFGYERNEAYFIDDYRNPVCAALGMAHQFDARKILLLCCDDSVENKKEYMIHLDNGLWTYPHHIKSQKIIDANLYWLTHQEDKEVKIADYSSGGKYSNAAYISSEQDALDFIVNQEE